MQITILALGSRGDVQPLAAVGMALRTRGAQVTLAAEAAFAPLAAACGLGFAPIAGDIQAALQSEDGARALESGANPVAMAGIIRRNVAPLVPRLIDDLMDATAQTDALLLGGAAYYPGSLLAEVRGIPFAQAYLQPMLPTAAFPSPMLPERARSGPLYNRLSYVVAGQLFWQVLRPLINQVRRERFGLRPWPLWGNFGVLRRERILQLFGYSRHLLPQPADWPYTAHVTGAWFLPEAPYTPPPALVDFLAAGPPPVCVGFGSMRHRDPQVFTAAILTALEQAQVRAVLLTGWGALAPDRLPHWAFALEGAPHTWLYPRCAAVVHHGGAGATHAALRAGRVAVVCPFFGDQPFWARRVAQLGLAPEPVAAHTLTAPKLAAQLRRALEDDALRRRAAEFGALLAAEPGAARAADLLLADFEARRAFGAD